jgi:hypothetical protein
MHGPLYVKKDLPRREFHTRNINSSFKADLDEEKRNYWRYRMHTVHKLQVPLASYTINDDDTYN